MPSITVYTKPACPQCRATLRALVNAGLDFDTVDISTDADARDFVMSLENTCRPRSSSPATGTGAAFAPTTSTIWPTTRPETC